MRRVGIDEKALLKNLGRRLMTIMTQGREIEIAKMRFLENRKNVCHLYRTISSKQTVRGKNAFQ